MERFEGHSRHLVLRLTCLLEVHMEMCRGSCMCMLGRLGVDLGIINILLIFKASRPRASDHRSGSPGAL